MILFCFFIAKYNRKINYRNIYLTIPTVSFNLTVLTYLKDRRSFHGLYKNAVKFRLIYINAFDNQKSTYFYISSVKIFSKRAK